MPLSGVNEAALADSYRRAGLALRAGFLRDYLALWRGLDLADVAGSSAAWLRLVLAVVGRDHSRAGVIAREYVTQARELALPDAEPVELPQLVQLDADALIRTMLRTGPGEYAAALRRGNDPGAAARRAFVTSSGAASMTVLDGGRDYVIEAVGADRRARGYMRVTDGDPCAFCAMLASRGPVYKSERTATDPRGSAARYHPGCGCIARPVYSRAEAMPDESKRFAELWGTSTKGTSGEESRKAFRRAYEADRAERLAGPVEPEPTDVEEKPAPKTVDEIMADAERRLAAMDAEKSRADELEKLPRKNAPSETTTRNAALDAQRTNPGYGSDRRYGVNCVHVTMAYDLRRRGYDVTASKLPEPFVNGRSADVWGDHWIAPEGGARRFRAATPDEIAAETADWPEGARGVILIVWKKGGAHVFNVEKVAGNRVSYFEAQTGGILHDPDRYFDRRGPERDDLQIIRTDDLTPTNAVLEFVNERG